MNQTIIVLMVILGGQVQEAATFNTLEECEATRNQIKETQSFCYERTVADPEQIVKQLGDIMRKMKEQLDTMSDKPKEQPTTI